MVFRPATPGFIITLAATICLALVSFSTPLLKSIYFLSATINHDSLQGTATFGVLGYCLQTGTAQACSNATVGWEFDPNALLSLNLPLNIEIPQVVVKWLTYVLVLHIVGLGFAAISTVFGLLAHVREMAMTCFSSCIAGTGATVVLLAFIFDLVFFFVIKARVAAVGGTATIGTGLWLTLAAWVMLFFSGVFFAIGRCCFSSRPRVPKGSKGGWRSGNGWGGKGDDVGPGTTGGISHSEAMRLEAIKAEADRKAHQAEVGLPAFPTNAEAVPLTKKPGAQYYVEEDSEDEVKPYVPVGGGAAGMAAGATGPHRRNSGSTTYTTNYAGRGRQQPSHQQQYAGGYMQGAPGTRSIDAYNNVATSFSPGPSGQAPYRQASGRSGYGYNGQPSSPPPMPVAQNGGYLPPGAAIGGVYPDYGGHQSPPPVPVAQNAGYLTPGAAIGDVYPGHGGQQSSYHSAVSHHTGQPSSYSQFDQPYPGNDQYYTQQQNQPQIPGAYPSQGQAQYGYDNQGAQYGYDNQATQGGYDAAAYTQFEQRPYVPPQTTSPAPYGDPYSNNNGGYSQPFAAPTRTYTPPTNQQQYTGGTYPAFPPPINTAVVTDMQAESRRSPISPRGPRSAGQGHVAPPWSQAGQQGMVPSEAPPEYDLPPPGAGGAAPYPPEKR